MSVKRVSSGYGEERGSLGVLLHNAHPYPVHAVWLEELPWWIKLYVHTLSKPSDDFFQTFDYRPARDRQSVTVIEAKMTLPPNSSTLLQMDYDKAYLRYTEYPPDAHRGLAVPPAVLTYWPSTGVKAHRVYSTSSLLMAPLPDFSMPYNVIVLTCTVLALAFGTIFNIIQRQFVAVDLNSIPAMASAPAPKPNLFSGLGGLLRRRKAKVA